MSQLYRPLDSAIPSLAGEVRINFLCFFFRLRTNDYYQYYSIAATTIFFYDFFLTLPDEVSHVIRVSLRYVYSPSRERSNTLGTGRNHGVRTKNRVSYAGP